MKTNNKNQSIEDAVKGEKTLINNMNQCDNYANDKCDCNYSKDCQLHTFQSTPVNEAKEVESVEQAAFKYVNTQKQWTANVIKGAINNAFIAGAEWRATHAIENKEGVKKALAALKNIVEYLDGNPTHKINPNTPAHVEAREALKAAQFTPIEQGKRMVSVEEVMAYLNSLNWPSTWWLGEIERQLNTMVKANQKYK